MATEPPAAAPGDETSRTTSRLARAALYSQDQLEAYAARLAGEHRLSDDPREARAFISRIEEIGRDLDDTYRFLTTASRTAQAVPSEDWLRDNPFVVQDQIRAVRRDLPRKFYLELP